MFSEADMSAWARLLPSQKQQSQWRKYSPPITATETPLSHHYRHRSSQTVPHRIGDPGRAPFGQLTVKGSLEMQRVGQQLRQRLIHQQHLLPPLLQPQLMYVRSTNISRTLHSAQNLLLGLYPPEARDPSDFGEFVVVVVAVVVVVVVVVGVVCKSVKGL